MIRKATHQDITNIMNIIKETIAIMKSENNDQWNETYPKKEDFLFDIQNESLYVIDENNQILGFVCIDFLEPKEYEEILWSENKPALFVHRLALSVQARNKGNGVKLLTFVEEQAKKKNRYYIKTDTYSLNSKMNNLFIKMGYQKMGMIYFHGKKNPFYCYEKKIEA